MKKILFFIGIFILALGLFFALTQAFHASGRIQETLVTEIHDHWGAQLSFREAKVIFSPFPALLVSKPRLESLNEGYPTLNAEEARFSIQIFPLLWGKIRLSGVQIREASGNLWGVALQKVDFEIKGLYSKRRAPYKCKAQGKDGKTLLEGKGNLIFDGSAEDIWKGIGLAGRFNISSFSLPENLDAQLLKRLPPFFQTSRVKTSLQISKEKGRKILAGELQLNMEGPKSENSAPLFLSAKSNLSFNPENDLLEFSQTSFGTPFGELQLTGIFNVETGEIKEARLMGRKIILEEVVHFFPGLDTFLPLNTGFSGESEFDLTVRGALDYLAIHANWSLTPAVLTYGTVFSKPKDFPMGINFDFNLKAKSILAGDFSVRIGETTVKGVLSDVNPLKREGEVTVLTNKFSLKDWSLLVTPFSQYQMSGFAKVLWSSKGALNLSLERASLISSSGKGIQEITGQFDMSPFQFKIKEALFKTGDSSLQIEADIYNAADKPQGKIQILSERINPRLFIENIRTLDISLLKQSGVWSELQKFAAFFLPNDVFEELTLKATLEPDKWTLEELEFRWLAGSVHLQGMQEQSEKSPGLQFEIQIDQISLARYFEGLGRANEALEGNLFFTGKFEAKGKTFADLSKTLTGQGTLSITNGKWYSFDLIGPLKHLEPFESLSSFQSDFLSFHDLKTQWDYKLEKFTADNLLIHSEDFWIEGKGNLSLEGILNSRLEVYLSSFLTEKLFQTWNASETTEGKKLGPLEYLAVGKLTKPELQMDDRSTAPLFEAIRSRRFRKLLREPFKG